MTHGLILLCVMWVVCGLVAIFTKDTTVLAIPALASLCWGIERVM